MYRVGIDLGGTNMKAGIVDENHKIVIHDSMPTRKLRISNDANCAALGEVMAGAAMKIKNAVLITPDSIMPDY